jgi:hypothetical protein
MFAVSGSSVAGEKGLRSFAQSLCLWTVSVLFLSFLVYPSTGGAGKPPGAAGAEKPSHSTAQVALAPPVVQLSFKAAESLTAFEDDSAVEQQIYFKPTNPDPGDVFGWSVAIHDDKMVVGAPNEQSSATGINGTQDDNSATTSGAAYVFVREGNTWRQQAYLKASNTQGISQYGVGGALFGYSVAIHGDTIVIGAPWERGKSRGVNGDQSDADIDFTGAAYVFVLSGGTWNQQAYIKPSNTPQQSPPDHNFQFGEAVAIFDDTVAVGALTEPSGAVGINGNQSDTSKPFSGAVYVFQRSGGSWTQQAYIKPSNTDENYNFGAKVALSGNTLAVGAPGESSSTTGVNGSMSANGAPFSGAAYVFVRNDSSWSQQAYVKASNTGEGDRFGLGLALDGDTLVVGAPQERSNAFGVNGDQLNNLWLDAGAAYVFTRNGSTWTQQAYLKASNTGFRDRFGSAVTLKEDSLFIGAPTEWSNATGVDSNQLDNSAEGAGAVYQFRRQAGEWQQVSYIKASNTDPGDNFGFALAVSGDHLAIGAPGEDSRSAGINAEQVDIGSSQTGAVYLFGGLTRSPFQINAGMNDAWVSSEAPFQGLFFSVYESISLFFLSWFTFDTVIPDEDWDAVFGGIDQRWVTGAGYYSGNSVTINVELTSGGRFHSDSPAAVQVPNYGTITIVFNSCNEAILTYNFPSLGVSGQMTLTRVLDDNVAICEILGGG